MPQIKHPPEPRVIDVEDRIALDRVAAELRTRPEVLTEVVAKVGRNRTAVELFLTAPRA